jgi:uncharacterized membrane protein
MNHVQKFGRWIIFGSAIALVIAKIMTHYGLAQNSVIFSSFAAFTLLVALFVSIGLVLMFSAYTQKASVLLVLFVIFFVFAEYIVLLTGGI